MQLQVNAERAKLVIQRLHDAFDKRLGLLQETGDLVENQIPLGVEIRSREHALFLFYTVANDHGMKSSRLYSRAKDLFQSRPDLFEPTAVLEKYRDSEDQDLFEDTGKFLGTRYPKETAKGWYNNSERLQRFFEGDPRGLCSRNTDAQDLLKEIKKFRGYGPKTGGLLLRAIVGLGFVTPQNLDKVLVPVDIHDSRISFFTGVVKAEGSQQPSSSGYYSHVRDVQQILRDTCSTLGLTWIDVDRALWIIGSRGCVRLRCSLCPIQDLCSVGSSSPQGRLPLESDKNPRSRRSSSHPV
jgi:endonuclease III